jgi:plastocyanin
VKRRVFAGIAASAAAAVFIGGATGAASEKVPTGAKVDVTDFLFIEDAVTVEKGQKVVWKFVEGKHNVTGKGFKSGNKTSGKYKYTFDKVGTFKYRCTLHQPDMDGLVKVVR